MDETIQQYDVHIVCGSAGVGKTTYAMRFAQSIRACLLDIDICSERLARTAMKAADRSEEDRDSPYFKQLLREPIYETLFDIANSNASICPCVIVGPFTRECQEEDWPKRLSVRLKRPMQQIRIHYLCCQRDTMKQRIVSRGDPRDGQKLDKWDEYVENVLTEERRPFPHYYLKTDGESFEEECDAIVKECLRDR